jgi:hypothetical protein
MAAGSLMADTSANLWQPNINVAASFAGAPPLDPARGYEPLDPVFFFSTP